MKKNLHFVLLGLALVCTLQATAQNVKIKGIAQGCRNDDGDTMENISDYVGWNSTLQKSIFIVGNGFYAMNWDGTTLSDPVKEPPVNKADFYDSSTRTFTDDDKALWANNFNLLYGNSGALYVNGQAVTVYSKDEQSTVDEELFAVRKWNAVTGDLLSSEIRPKDDCLESAGMAYNPVDGKVYGLFYLTSQQLPEEITSDPDYFVDTEGEASSEDAGYCLCSIDLQTMDITPITPGLYYYNFITFAINSEGRAFALTSGGANGTIGDDGRMRDINGNLTGAQLCEFNLENGRMYQVATPTVDPETDSVYIDYSFPVAATGYASQYRRQAACFAKSNPNKMYWVGYYNSGKGINDWGSWSTLPDREWRTNGKYDTALYEIDITTGLGTRLAKVPNRWTFSAIWVDGDDTTEGADIDVTGSTTQQAYIALSTAENGAIWQQVEQGKQYTYRLEPAVGWKVHSVTFNNQDITDQVTANNTITTPAINGTYSTLFVTFESDATGGIQATEKPATEVKILGKEGGISVQNAKPGDVLQVYTANGQLVLSKKLTADKAEIALDSKRLYIIKVANKVVKARL
jgi:hypothetical protein